MNNIPNHIAIIPDGNRRWAKKRKLKPWQGHYEGAKRFEEVGKEAADMGIKYLTIWGGSYDNLTKRSKSEINALDRAYREEAKRALKDKDVIKNTRVRIIGEYNKLLSSKTIDAFKELEEKTKNNTKNNLTLLIGYNGDREMLSAIKKIARRAKGQITEKIIKNNLWTKELPPVDLVIRTGNEPHLSAGFMMWDVKYSVLHFSDKLWPDFTKTEFKKAIKEFSSRERRKGK